jgi:hypothetical protein
MRKAGDLGQQENLRDLSQVSVTALEDVFAGVDFVLPQR